MSNHETTGSGKNAAIVAYLTLIGTIIAFFINYDHKNKFAYFHIRQALGLFLSFFIISAFIGYFDSLMISVSFYVFFLVLWVYGFSSAISGTSKPIPLIGDYIQKIFNIIGND